MEHTADNLDECTHEKKRTKNGPTNHRELNFGLGSTRTLDLNRLESDLGSNVREFERPKTRYRQVKQVQGNDSHPLLFKSDLFLVFYVKEHLARSGVFKPVRDFE